MNSTIPLTRALKRRPQVSASPLLHVSHPALTAFNPALPVDDSLVVAGELRDQFNGLKDLIDAIQTITAAVVDDVTTLPPGDPAAVTLSVSNDTLHFSFAIPQGQEGTGVSGAVVDGVTTLDPGEPAAAEASWADGVVHFSFSIPRGEDGSEGAPGPPFADAVVDGVTTLDPNEPATVEVSFDGTLVHFTFGIPKGHDGDQGPEGPPGQVSFVQLTDAIATTSSNSDAVTTLSMTVSDPPTRSEVQLIADKIDELINALRR